MSACQAGCTSSDHTPKLVVLTGGPGGGKTAILELARKAFCEHVVVLPESATIVFGGGFPRRATDPARRAAQRAIARVQVELERMAIEERQAAVILCDRGTIDGLAYWPGAEPEFWAGLQTTREAELCRYAAVVHVRTPPAEGGYDRANALRIESAIEAARLDERIALGWSGHPRRFVVASQRDFMTKASAALAIIESELPECCRGRSAHLPAAAPT